MSASRTLDPDPMVDVGFGVDPSMSGYLYIGDPIRGKIGTGLIGPDTVWTDVTQYVQSISYDIGKNRAGETWKAGSCSIQFKNQDGRFDPANLSGPYVSVGETQVVPMRRLRVRLVPPGVSIGPAPTRFTGYVDDIVLTYPGNGKVAVATFPATDGYKVLANYTGAPSTAVGGGESTGARINRILDNAAWPEDDRDIETGDLTVQATLLEDSALSEIELVAFSEGGEVFMSADGKVTFRARSSRLSNPRSLAPYDSFDDDDYASIVVKNDADLVVNNVRFTSPDAVGRAVTGTGVYRPDEDIAAGGVTGTPDASNYYADLNSPSYSSTVNISSNTPGSSPSWFGRVNISAGDLTGNTIDAVRLVSVAASLGNLAFAAFVVIDGVQYFGPVSRLPATPAGTESGWSVNPSTGRAWTTADVEAFGTTGGIGFFASPSQSVGDFKAYQFWLEVDYTGVGTGGNVQTAADSASVARYLTRTKERTDLILEDDDDTRRLADWYLYTHKDYQQRFEEVTFRPARDATGVLWQRLLDLQFFDRITLSNTPPSGITSTGDYFIIGISERMSVQSKQAWELTLKLESAAPYTGFLLVGDATLGLIGTGLIG